MKNQVMINNITQVVSVARKNEYAYFVSGNHGILYRVNLKTWAIEKVHELPLSGDKKTFVLLKENSLFCVPIDECKVIEYSIETSQILCYTSNSIKKNYTTRILCAILFNDKIYFIPQRLDKGILIFDIIEKTYHWNDVFKNVKHKYQMIQSYCQDNEWMTLVVSASNVILQYNLDTSEVRERVISTEHIILCVQKNKSHYVFTLEQGEGLLFWDEKENSILFKDTPKAIRGYRNMIFGRDMFLVDGSYLYLCRNEKLLLLQSRENLGIIMTMYICCLEFEGKYVLFPWSANEIIEIDKDSLCITSHKYTLEMKDIACVIQRVGEGECLLLDYIKLIKDKNNLWASENRSKIGHEIYYNMKN